MKCEICNKNSRIYNGYIKDDKFYCNDCIKFVYEFKPEIKNKDVMKWT